MGKPDWQDSPAREVVALKAMAAKAGVSIPENNDLGLHELTIALLKKAFDRIEALEAKIP